MLTKDQLLSIEIKMADGSWQPCSMDALEPGDVIRQKMPSGEVVPYPNGNTEGLTEMVVVEQPTMKVRSNGA